MTSKIGLVVVDVDDGESFANVEQRIISAKSIVPPGRCLAVLHRSNSDWTASAPYESLIVRCTVGSPTERQGSQFEFFANGVTRAYKFEKGLPRYTGTLHWTLIRRLGERAYSRRQSLSKPTLQENELPVLHKVFTRDVANNVWHLRESAARRGTVNRLSRLLAWSDERVAIASITGVHFKKVVELNLDKDLVGVADRVPSDVGRVLGLELF